MKPLSGKFGKLTVVKFHHMDPKQGANWLCRCDCGNQIVLPRGKITSGNTRSCGCLYLEAAAKMGRANATHGHSSKGVRSPTYISWAAMIQRCEQPNAADAKWYGARGIKVCKRWHDFSAFLADMGERPKGRTLDRIDPNGDYGPGNCRWATAKEQRANQRK